MTVGSRQLAEGALVMLACLMLTGCGGSGSGSQSSASTGTSTTGASLTSSAVRRRPRAQGRPGKPVGRTQLVHAGSSTLKVTVTRVFDPLRDSGAALPPGTRAVGVAVAIQNERGATYDSTASGDVSISTSAGIAAPLFIKQGVCETPLTDFESLIAVGETRTGCVAFAVPRPSKILAVRFSPDSRRTGSVTWR